MVNSFICIWLYITAAWAVTSLDKLNVEPKFRVQFDPELVAPAVLESHPANGTYETAGVVRFQGPDAWNVKYACAVPTVGEEFWERGKKQPDTSVRSGLVKEVVESLEYQVFHTEHEDCKLTFGLNGGYWTYGYCFGDKIIQFHENITRFYETNVHVPEHPNKVFVLGRFRGTKPHNEDIDNVSTPRSTKLNPADFEIVNDPFNSKIGQLGQQVAIQHSLDNGGICDVTNQPRSVSVIYRCDPKVEQYYIVSVEELKTCEYQIVVGVKQLCEFDEFRPNLVDDKVFTITCSVLDDSLSSEQKSLMRSLQLNHTFPQPRSLHIDLNQYKIIPGGYNFFWGRLKNAPDATDLYETRTILVSSYKDGSTGDLLKSAAQMFSNSMISKILSPDPASKSGMASWADTFTVWYELYDYHGNFDSLVRIHRNGTKPGHEIEVQVVDAFTMLDHEGDAVAVGAVSDARKYWQFEHYSAASSATVETTSVETATIDEEVLSVEEVIQEIDDDFLKELSSKLDNIDLEQLKNAFDEMGLLP